VLWTNLVYFGLAVRGYVVWPLDPHTHMSGVGDEVPEEDEVG